MRLSSGLFSEQRGQVRTEPAAISVSSRSPADQEVRGCVTARTRELLGDTTTANGLQSARKSGQQLPRTVAMIRSATITAGSCSQNRRTVQPASRSETFVSSSRTRLRATFIAQKSAFVLATVWWSGQPCQKHPSMKIATLERVKTKSALRRRRSDNGEKSTRYRNPAAWTRLRTASSGRVSRLRLPIMERRVCSLDAHDSATPPVSPLRMSGMRSVSGRGGADPEPVGHRRWVFVLPHNGDGPAAAFDRFDLFGSLHRSTADVGAPGL